MAASKISTRARTFGILAIGALAFFALLLLAATGATAVDRSSEPGDLFPVLEREATEADALPNEPAAITEGVEMLEVEGSRLLGESSDARFYVVEDARDVLCMAQLAKESHDGMPYNINCSHPEYVAENGLLVAGQWLGGPLQVAYGLPDGYNDEVVDGNGEQISEVDGQLFTVSFGPGDERPDQLIARGSAGELSLGAGFLGEDN